MVVLGIRMGLAVYKVNAFLFLSTPEILSIDGFLFALSFGSHLIMVLRTTADLVLGAGVNLSWGVMWSFGILDFYIKNRVSAH